MPNEFMKRYGDKKIIPSKKRWIPKTEQQMRIEIESIREQLICLNDELLDKWMVDEKDFGVDDTLHSIWEQINQVIERLNKI